jgi:hypothetical protein
MDSSRPRISQRVLHYCLKHVLWLVNWIFQDWKRVAIIASCGHRRLSGFVLYMPMSLIAILVSIQIALVVRLRVRGLVSRFARGVRRSGTVVRYVFISVVFVLRPDGNYAYALHSLHRFVKSRLGPDITSMNASYSKIRSSRLFPVPYERHCN